MEVERELMEGGMWPFLSASLPPRVQLWSPPQPFLWASWALLRLLPAHSVLRAPSARHVEGTRVSFTYLCCFLGDEVGLHHL